MATPKKLKLDKTTVTKLHQAQLESINGGESPTTTLNIKCIGDAISRLINCKGEIL